MYDGSGLEGSSRTGFHWKVRSMVAGQGARTAVAMAVAKHAGIAGVARIQYFLLFPVEENSNQIVILKQSHII